MGLNSWLEGVFKELIKNQPSIAISFSQSQFWFIKVDNNITDSVSDDDVGRYSELSKQQQQHYEWIE
jgi:hypothetical protein